MTRGAAAPTVSLPQQPPPVPFAIGTLTLPDGTASIVALIPQNALLVRGTADSVRRLEELIAQTDAPTPQTTLEVMLLEMKPEDMKELSQSGEGANVLTPQQLRTALQRLGNKAKVLSTPHVTTVSGYPAGVYAIAQTPETGRITAGTRLSFTPRSNRDGTIALHAHIEVFRPDGHNVVSSTTTVPSGSSAVIGGLPKDANKVLTVIVTPRVTTPPRSPEPSASVISPTPKK